MYFSFFPVLPYDVNGDGRVTLTTNIMKRVRVRANVQKNISLLIKYPVQDGDTPEMVADKHFDNPHYHWIILLKGGLLWEGRAVCGRLAQTVSARNLVAPGGPASRPWICGL